jgi:hypothetical protein
MFDVVSNCLPEFHEIQSEYFPYFYEELLNYSHVCKIQLSDGHTLLTQVNTNLVLLCLFPDTSGWSSVK